MMLPPGILWLAVVGKRGKRVKIWLPLFLLWPIGLAAALLFYAVYLFFFWAWIWNRNGWRVGIATWRLYLVVCAMRGLIVDVEGDAANFAFCLR